MLVHERIDWGFAHLATLLSGGGQIGEHLPPWYADEGANEDTMLASLRSLADRGKAREVT